MRVSVGRLLLALCVAAPSTAAWGPALSPETQEQDKAGGPAADVAPELRQQLRAAFEPARKAALEFLAANANLRKSADSGNIGKMDSAMKKAEKAAGALEKKKQEVMPKANATGATGDQVQAEWVRWLDEIKEETGKKR